MAQVGRPPKPLEQKRLTGRTPGTDSGGRKLPPVASVTTLPARVGDLEPPEDFGLEARELWRQAWDSGITWLSPATDMREVIEACRAVDDVAKARARYRATTDPADMRALVSASKMLTEALSALGFNPTARSRLGVAEVKRVSALEQLAARRNSR